MRNLTSYVRAIVVAATVSAAFTPALRAADAVNWNLSQTGTGVAAQTSLLTGISGIYALVYSCLWVACAIALGFCAFKFKKGDAEAGLWGLGGGAFLGLIPVFVQWFRSMGGVGNLF